MRKVKTRIKTDRFHGDGREGGSLLYVIFFITLLSVFACGFMAVSRYHIKMALKNRAYMEARLTTHMIHNSFCEAVSKGESDALRLLWNQYEGDLEDEEAEENENEDIPETEGAGADGITKLDADVKMSTFNAKVFSCFFTFSNMHISKQLYLCILYNYMFLMGVGVGSGS